MWGRNRRHPRLNTLHSGRFPQTNRRQYTWTRQPEAASGKEQPAGASVNVQNSTVPVQKPATPVNSSRQKHLTGAQELGNRVSAPTATKPAPKGLPPVTKARPALRGGGYVKKRSNQLLRVSPSARSERSARTTRVEGASSARTKPAGNSGTALQRQGKHKLVRQTSIVSAAAKALVRARPSARFSNQWTREGASSAISKPSLRRPNVLPGIRGGRGIRGNKWPPVKSKPAAYARAAVLRGGKLSNARLGAHNQLVSKHAPGKLVRISETMYKVAKSGKSLQRQPIVVPVPSAKKTVIGSTPAKRVLQKSIGPSAQRLLMLQRLKRGASNKWTPNKALQVSRPIKKQQTVISQIRQRSKFVNSVCLDFCRKGTCAGKMTGKCRKVHDPAKVAVCHFWLAGKCSNADCPLQHRVMPDLMPLCLHFAKGSCSTHDCPYLHIKHNARTPVCKDFLEGFCPKGAACSKRHLTAKMLRASRASTANPQAQNRRRRAREGQMNIEPPAKRQAVRSSEAHGAGPSHSRDADPDLRPEFLKGLF